MFIIASGKSSRLVSSPDLVSSISFSESPDISTLDVFDYETGVHRGDEMYRVQEVAGECLALGEKPTEDYVVLG